MQLDWLDGEMIDQCGQDHRPVSRSQQRVKKKESQTSATSGPFGSTLSGSADLQQFLVSKLAQRFATAGLTNSKLTWKTVITPSGRSLSRLQVSVLCIDAKGSGSWPTATSRDHKGGYPGGRIRNGKLSVDTLDVAAQLTADSGIHHSQSRAKTAKSGSSHLNPRFSLWLMGYPIEWAYCGERVTPLSRRSRQK